MHAVLIYYGLRHQELLGLTLQAVNLLAQSLLVRQSKGKKARTGYLCDEATTALREWAAFRQRLKIPHDDLFATED